MCRQPKSLIHGSFGSFLLALQDALKVGTDAAALIKGKLGFWCRVTKPCGLS
jgi:hypothetical protein